ncbi:HipA domain-containing protein [Williamsia sp. MIQD14]|uniref:HipA domain-containing protein n=1 Tax=Williamsia sp. MIQD14 TaxID=3425703 RepID=UPI003DA0C31F
MTYEVCDIADWVVVSQEARGLDPKDWVAEQKNTHLESQSEWWVFKPIKNASYRRCDDWSEKVASELATLIGLPAARVELAERHSEIGIISKNVTPDGFSLESGDTLLSEFDGYVTCAGDHRPKNRVGHNLDNIQSLLAGIDHPESDIGGLNGFDLFTGYLIFDAWIANTDRHAINWGVLISNDDGLRRVAPSFDHGSALASGAQDAHLATVDVAAYAARGYAHRFEGGETLSLCDLAHQALTRSSEHTRVWIDRICAVETVDLEAIVRAIPGMSDVRRRFLLNLLTINQRRLAV